MRHHSIRLFKRALKFICKWKRPCLHHSASLTFVSLTAASTASTYRSLNATDKSASASMTQALNRCCGQRRIRVWEAGRFCVAAAHCNEVAVCRMLFIGRVLLGIAVAMASVAVTLYNSEMAPAQHRGRLNQIFQVFSLPPPA